MESMGLNIDLESVFRGKKVFITGHTGFKGIWLSALLHRLGAQLKGYSLEPVETKPFYDLISSKISMEQVFSDIRDKDRLHEEIFDFNPDFVFHLAAQSLVIKSYEIPADTFDVNVVGTANLLEVVRDLNKQITTIVVTTDKVYENVEDGLLFKETDRLGGHDPYSASKACTEIVVDSFRKSFFSHHDEILKKPIATARAGNVIGGGDWNENRIIPDIIKSLQKGETIVVRNPNAVRPWQHVLEPLIGYLQLAALLEKYPETFSSAFNFGPLPSDHLTVKELTEYAVKIWGQGKITFANQLPKYHEARLLQLDITKSTTQLHWRPKLTASDAIKWSIDWYKMERSEQADFTFSQIENYLSL